MYYEIIKGEDKEIPLKIRDAQDDPVDLTNKVISGVLKGCPENVLLPSASFTHVSDVLGKLVMKITKEQTEAMKEGVNSFEVVLVQGDQKRIVQFKNLVEVKRRI